MKVLIIEDDKMIANSIAEAFQKQGHLCKIAYSYEDAIFELKSGVFDVITLDLLLDKHRGESILRKLKISVTSTPVLIVSGIVTDKSKIALLKLGVADYITKPFSKIELVLRAENIHKRSFRDTERKHKSLSYYRNIKFDWKNLTVWINSRSINITKNEKAFLQLLLESKKNIVSKSDISIYLWGGNGENKSNKLDVLVTRLRTKLCKITETDLVISLRGSGYKLSSNKVFVKKYSI